MGAGHSQPVTTLQGNKYRGLVLHLPPVLLLPCPAQPEAKGPRRPLIPLIKVTYQGTEQDAEGQMGSSGGANRDINHH